MAGKKITLTLIKKLSKADIISVIISFIILHKMEEQIGGDTKENAIKFIKDTKLCNEAEFARLINNKLNQNKIKKNGLHLRLS
jgi:hypothetical protein